MTTTCRRALLGGILALAALPLAACDEEPAQRKAFMAFLQTRILDKPGIHVARPTADEAKSFGDYAKHYAVVTDFHDALNRRVMGPLNEAMRNGSMRSIPDLLARRAELDGARRSMAELRGAIAEEAARAEAARAALKQPADLKPVFDAAFERNVAGPAKAFQESLPAGEAAIAAALDVASYLDQHRGRIEARGTTVQMLVPDPALQREITARVEAMTARAREAQAAQQRLQAMIRGG